MTVTSYKVAVNPSFVGRKAESGKLSKIEQSGRSGIIVVHGRRRSGKTELIEQHFGKRNLLKFEGIEASQNPKTKEAGQVQRDAFALQLADYIGYSEELLTAKTSWTLLFKLVGRHTATGKWTLYFDELQWLANYEDELVAELKYVWDNFFRRNPQLILVLCGSSPSFMKNQVLKSKSLYSRSMHELRLKPFRISETREFLGPDRTDASVLDCYLSVGGIPEYLHYFKKEKSILKALTQETFRPDGYFVNEYDRIFVSSLNDNEKYRAIVNNLAQSKYSSRNEIAKALGISNGGKLSTKLDELVDAGLIDTYGPYNAAAGSKLVRYSLADPFLHFYAKFVLPELANIQQGAYEADPMRALPLTTYRQWLGYSLERFCRINSHNIANLLGFAGIKYKAGAHFKRPHQNDGTGYQIDLVFDRSDSVISVCEMKYLAEPVGTEIISEFSAKLAKANFGTKEVQKVLIAPNGVRNGVVDRAYFDEIITIDPLMEF